MLHIYIHNPYNKNGITEIPHAGTISLYNMMLGKAVKKKILHAIVDDAPSFVGTKRFLADGPSGHVKRFRALLNPHIEEVEEIAPDNVDDGDGEDDEADHDNNDDNGADNNNEDDAQLQAPKRRFRSKQGPKQHYVVPDAGFEWGPFEFKRIDQEKRKGKNKGQIISSFQCICKFHKDEGAPAGTVCQRTRQFNDANRDEVVRQLKVWALIGRQCDGHAQGDTPHKDVNIGHYPSMSMDEVESELIVALSEPDWLTKTGDDAGEVEPAEINDGNPPAGSSLLVKKKTLTYVYL